MTKHRHPKALFSTGFDDIATAWHKNPRAPAAALELIRMLMALEGLSVAEGLIVAPKMSFRVFGENVVLCRLIEMFGVAGVEQLLEEDAVEFVLWKGMVLHMEKPLEGVFPILAGNHNSPAHADPAASVELGLKGWSGRNLADMERLAKLAIDRTHVPDEQLPHVAVAAVKSAFESGRFAADGLDPLIPPHRLPAHRIAQLSRLGERVVEASVAMKGEYDFHDARKTWEALVQVTSAFRDSDALHKTAEEVLRLEGLPNIPALITKGGMTFEDVVRVRSSDATKEFRDWLWSQPSPADAKAVGERYVAAIKPGAKTSDKTWFKTLRVATVSVVGSAAGSAVGAAVAGVPGMVLGGAVGLATSLGDTFGIERFFRGKSPRRFADEEIRPRVAEMLLRTKELTESRGVASATPKPVGASPTTAVQPESTNRHARRAKAANERRKEKDARRARSAQKAKQRAKR